MTSLDTVANMNYSVPSVGVVPRAAPCEGSHGGCWRDAVEAE